jgi:hypothetical protein
VFIIKTKNLVFILIILLIIAIASCSSYYLGISVGIAHAKTEESENFALYDVFRVDYPLIEIGFINECEWLLIDRANLFTSQEKYSIIQQNKELQFGKEWLWVLTFPSARGITPKGVVYIYKDGILIKEVPYYEVYCESESLKNAFQEVTKAKIEEMINKELPPII